MRTFGDGRALAIVNPAAGGGRGERRLRELVRIFKAAGGRVDIARTPAEGEATRLARDAARDGYARVIVVGGDGTLNEVANGIVGTDVSLAVVPMGTANDFARALGVPKWREAARLAVQGTTRPIDAALVNGRVIANCVGVGLDAAGVSVASRHKRIVGPFAYFTAAVQTIATFRPLQLRLTLDGEVVEGPRLLVVASNTERFANGMRIAPGAVVNDGLLDVCIVGDTPVPVTLVLLAKVYRGTHVGHPKVRMARVRELLIEQPRVLPVELDGELMRADRVEVRCVPGALAVVTPG